MITLYESRHLSEGGFFRFLFRAIRSNEAEVEVKEGRPVEAWRDARGVHDGAWVDWKGKKVFFDMSDHVFQFDEKAWEEADLYFKANLNRDIARDVVGTSEETKLRSFCFFPPTLPRCVHYRRLAQILPWRKRSLCHIVGVYENPCEGNPDRSAPEAGEILSPNVMHFWIRKAFRDAIYENFTDAFSRLTSRGNSEIEDGLTVQSNLKQPHFLWKILTSKFCVLNTYPHAVYPWKAFESLALGVPFIVESGPLIEIPEAFRPVKDRHFLQVLPDPPVFESPYRDENASTYRVVVFPGMEAIRRGIEEVQRKVMDGELVGEMRRNARDFARSRLSAEFLYSWLDEEIMGK